MNRRTTRTDVIDEDPVPFQRIVDDGDGDGDGDGRDASESEQPDDDSEKPVEPDAN